MSHKTNIAELPFVTFEYPDSNTNRMRPRFVAVTSMDRVYVKGYETQSYTARNPEDTEWKFKKYRVDRIVTNGVHLRLWGNV